MDLRSQFIEPLDTEHERRRMRRWLSSVMFVQLCCWVAVFALLPAPHVRIVSLAQILWCAMAVVLARRKQLTPVRVFVPVSWVISFITLAALGGGAQDLAMGAFPIVAIFCIVVLGKSAAVLATFVAIATVFGLSLAQRIGLISTTDDFNPLAPYLWSIIYIGTLLSLWVVRWFAEDDLKIAVRSQAEAEQARGELASAQVEILQHQSALEDSQARYRLLAENVHDVVWVVDMQLTPIYCSPSVERQRGFTVEEIMAFPPLEQFAESSQKKMADVFRQELEKENDPTVPKDRTTIVEYEVRCKDGSTKWTEGVMSFLRDEDGNPTHVVGITRDISARKAAQEENATLQAQILEMQKLESLGVLAGSIAHDFNNLLTAITGQAEIAYSELPADASTRTRLERLIGSADRAADLCRQLLAYSGRGHFVVEPTDLSSLVREMQPLLAVSVGKANEFQVRTPDELPAVEADATQLRQILMNLVINASEATDGGLVGVETGVVQGSLDHPMNVFVHPDCADREQHVFVRVTDTGPGMSEDVRAHIFEPFFTTKPKGHGLGLAAIQGIVRGHRGAIRVESHIGTGTSITLFLPITTQSVRPATTTEIGDRTEAQMAGTILAVDDETAILEILDAALSEQGMNVITATSGEDAIEIYRARSAEIRAVILDLTMPRMSGEATYHALRKIRPDVRAILSSGYSEDEISSRFNGNGPISFLQKPYTIDALINHVAEALHRKPESD